MTNQITISEVENLLKKYSHLPEPQMVKNFCNALDQRTLISSGKLIKITAKAIHHKPLISTIPSLTKSGKMELGDILFILKDKTDKSDNFLKRACISQVKKDNKNGIINIPLHQWKLYSDINKFQIHFDGFRGKISPKSSYFLNFLLHFSRAFNSTYIAKPRLSSNILATPCTNHISLSFPPLTTLTLLSFRYFLLNFINEKIGENLNAHRSIEVRSLVSELLKFVGLLPDPPEEFEEYYENGAFGVVIFNIVEKVRR